MLAVGRGKKIDNKTLQTISNIGTAAQGIQLFESITHQGQGSTEATITPIPSNNQIEFTSPHVAPMDKTRI